MNNSTLLNSESSVVNVGIILDETYFFEREKFVEELLNNGINRGNIQLLVFKDKLKKNESFKYPVFSYKNLSWTSSVSGEAYKCFVAQNFDMLISYYDVEKTPLLLATYESKAKFKVGFTSVDKRLNHFMIHSNAENYAVFLEELFKYLKILNKI
nr:hypothetical protein [Flavobacterium aciduliphilum]